MKKFTFFFCALMLCLSARAVPELKVNQKMSKDDLAKQQILNEKMQKQVPSAKFVAGTKPIMKAPAAKKNAYNVTIVSCVGTNYGSQIQYIMNDEDALFRFAFDILLPDTTQEDVTLGQTYTLADMNPKYTWGGNPTTGEYYPSFTAVTFVKTMDATTGLVNVTVNVTDEEDNVYNLSYQEEPLPIATDTISIVIPSAQLEDYTATHGIFRFKGTNDDYYVYAAFYGNQIEGTYEHDDLYLQYTYIYDFANDTARINVLSGDADITFANDTFLMDAYYLGEDAHCYHVLMSYYQEHFVPTGDTVYLNITNKMTYKYYTEGDWWFQAENADYKVRIDVNNHNPLSPAGVYTMDSVLTKYTDITKKADNTKLTTVDLNATITEDANGHIDLVANMLMEDGNVYHVILFYEPPFAEDTVIITANNLMRAINYTYKMHEFTASNNDYSVTIRINGISAGTYTSIAGYVTNLVDSTYTDIHSGSVTIAYTMQGYTLTGNVLCENNTEYTLNLDYVIPPVTRTQSINIPSAKHWTDSTWWQLYGWNSASDTYVLFSIWGNLSPGQYSFADIYAQRYTYVYEIRGTDSTYYDVESMLITVSEGTNGTMQLSGTMIGSNRNNPTEIVEYTISMTYTPCFIKNNWGTGDEWIWKEMRPNYNNTVYTYTGVFGGTGVYINTTALDSGALWFPIADMVVTTEPMMPQSGDSVRIEFSADSHTCTITILKRPGLEDLCSIGEEDTICYTNDSHSYSLRYEITSLYPSEVEVKGILGISSLDNKLDVSIPESIVISGHTFLVTSIGDNAFDGDIRLTSIVLPESLKYIGYCAFRNCDGLKSITIPKKIEHVRKYAFINCDSLRSVVWNASDRWCITPSFHLTDVAIFPTTVERFTFGNGVQYIPHYLCKGMDKLTSVILPNSLKEIGVGAFQDCIGLTSILIPDSVSYICKDAFSGCYNLNLVIWNARYCQNIDYQVTSYDSKNDLYNTQKIANSSCPFSSTIQTFIFGDNVQLIPAGICREMYLLSSIALPNTVTEIGRYAFFDCSGLISFTMENGVQTIGYSAFSNCTNLPQIALSNTVTEIGDEAFSNCVNLTTATIGNNVYSIGKSAFEYCVRLMSIELPATVDYIGRYAFSNCPSMNKAIIHSTAELDPDCMILFCLQIDTIIAPASIFDFDELNRSRCPTKIKYVRVNSGELTEDALAVIRRSASTLETLDVAATTNTTLADEAFSNMYNLTTLALPQNLERISYMAVAGCKMLPSISIPATVTEIGTSAFEHCRSLQTVIFSGNNLQTIGNWAFYNNHVLQHLAIPSGVTTIGAGAFYGCNYLEELAMPASLRNVGDNAFALCNHLTKMQVEADLPPMVAARTFFDVSRNIPVYVPDEAVNDYRNTAIWQEFFIRPISQAATGIGEVEQDGQEGTGMLPDGKFMQNGQLFIRKNGRVYDTQGRLIE